MVFWDRVVLKDRAKDLLRRTYWMAFVVALVAGLVGSSGGFTFRYDSSYTSFREFLYYGYYDIGPYVWNFLTGSSVVISILAVAFGIFVSNMAELGRVRYFSAARYGNASFTEIFFGFKNGFYMKNVLAMFMVKLFTFLWSLLFVIPGIVKGYSYFMVPYIIAENPTISWERAFDISKRTTNGEKWEMFVLDLSFLGWILLTVMTCGIGMLFLNPYIYATKAELYGALRYKAVQQGICTRDEIGSELA